MSETVSSVEPVAKEPVTEPTAEETKTGDETVPPPEKALPTEMATEGTEKPADTPVADAAAIPLPAAVEDPPAADALAVPATETPTEETKVVEGEAVQNATEDTKPAETETKPADIEVA